MEAIQKKSYTDVFKRNLVQMYLRGRNGRRLRENIIFRKARFIIGLKSIKRFILKTGL